MLALSRIHAVVSSHRLNNQIMTRAAVLVAVLLALGASPAAAADSVGLVDRSQGYWYLRDTAGGTTSFFYGNPGDTPFMGDWDCDGVDTPGLYRRSDGFVYLRNANTAGVADVSFFFGDPGDVPVAGDFDGDGCDTVSIYRPSQARFYVIDRLGSGSAGLGSAERMVTFGDPGDRPLAADFDGDGVDDLGVHRPSDGRIFYKPGAGTLSYLFGNPGDVVVAGDWTGDGAASAAAFRGSSGEFLLRHRNRAGTSDHTFEYGNALLAPVAGRFGTLPGGAAPPPQRLPAADLRLERIATITGAISPKSVVSSGTGLFFAQNMMYRHTITVYDRNFELVKTIPDTVDLAGLGVSGYSGTHRGAPVEAVFTSDGAHGYVSNYQMYGAGFGRPGGDGCGLAGWDESFVYRIDTETLEIDQAIGVGAVPKFLAITPDDSTVLVTNWCTFDMSVIDTASGAEVARVALGRHPRGIAVTPDGRAAFVAVMGSRDIARVDLGDLSVSWLRNIGAGPRHLVLAPDGSYLYASLNSEGRLVKIDTASGEVVGRVSTGSGPRSMVLSIDGTALYVGNYHSDTVSKVTTSDMSVVQRLPVPHHPIGMTLDAATGNVWGSSYSGAITVFEDAALP